MLLSDLDAPTKKQRGGARPGAGRPRSNAPRCACGRMTLHRAQQMRHKCTTTTSEQ